MVHTQYGMHIVTWGEAVGGMRVIPHLLAQGFFRKEGGPDLLCDTPCLALLHAGLPNLVQELRLACREQHIKTKTRGENHITTPDRKTKNH